MSILILIKHSLPDLQLGMPASQWHLSPEGRTRARVLATRLEGYGLQYILSSQEPKAVETTEILANELNLPFQVAPNLHEHVRPAVTSFDQTDFRSAVKVFFKQPSKLVYGEETADQAHERFRKAVKGIVETHPGQNLAIVSHGTVISLFVSRACGVEPFPLWESLELPSFIVLEQVAFEGFKISTKA